MSEISTISSNSDPFIYATKEQQEVAKKSKAKEAIEVGNEPKEDILELDLEGEIEKILGTIVEKQTSINSNILNRILRLITDLLPLMQKLAVAQANKLDLSTDMQAFYTDLIANAPFYTEKDFPDKTARDEANNKVMSNNDLFRAFRDQWSDIAKKDQTIINTSNEAVNQLVDQLTTIFQQLKELVSLITRG